MKIVDILKYPRPADTDIKAGLEATVNGKRLNDSD